MRNALFARTDLLRRVQALFDQADVIVTPTVSVPALPVSQRADRPLMLIERIVGVQLLVEPDLGR
ncbi:hypothetical protein [Bradyrhizobium sp. C9]|uniref:hypothetical protein n=1 Tax=Bradyrhizobium sp. C9 TaxID=142585 RepID=UPI000BE90DEA|nr:hypothetical protein [Bradyrhizobium sp. C9]PDT74147.1 hypothetical protein CO675_27130 [Bradyrhizobium sp. C9]